MATYTFEIRVSILENGMTTPVETLTGEVEAERYSTACVKSWPLINEECARIQAETCCQTAVGHLHVERQS